MKIERTVHTLDAQDQIAGRLASRIAVLLQGKNRVTYQSNVDGGDAVAIENVDKMKFTGRKLTTKLYHRFTGYPGGIRTLRLDEVFAKRPDELLRRMVYAMLPKNKLRPNMIKRLTFAKKAKEKKS
ncbi:MAG: 50S ribosomal protein L13 [Candidatus Komeilibacteria bacterium]|nr:50S ribosomal protein L13 [Candidatus Komeilibacteria bacterium]